MTDKTAHVLVVDDNRLNGLESSRMLQNRGHTVTQVRNGKEALTVMKEHPFDLVLLDILMPEMDGYEVLAHMHQDEALRDIPVIVISALDEMDSIVRCVEMGAEDYLAKPFDPVLLKARIGAGLEKKRLRDQERAYLEQLQASNEALDAFAHTVAHDLKTPLGVIHGIAEMVESNYNRLTEAQLKEYLHVISQNGIKLASITDELLLLASVRKMSEVDLEAVEMGDIIESAQQRLTHMIESHEVEFTSPESWPVVLSYGPWLEEVWVNYISNAIQYGGRPPLVEIGATAQANGEVCFWVCDNGPGLTPEEQARLFTPFTRLDQVSTKGHGLGLSIVKRIVEKLGGRVGVESGEGMGSTFSFTLPGSNTN